MTSSRPRPDLVPKVEQSDLVPRPLPYGGRGRRQLVPQHVPTSSRAPGRGPRNFTGDAHDPSQSHFFSRMVIWGRG